MTVTSTPPGIPGPARLEAWISENLDGGGPAELSGIELIAGGRSNLTYRLTLTSAPNGRGKLSCAARRSATCCPPRTTCPGSSGSCPA